jgi:hypothetical protein
MILDAAGRRDYLRTMLISCLTRRRLGGPLVAPVLFFAAVAYLEAPISPGVSRSNFDRIYVGMPESRVFELLGPSCCMDEIGVYKTPRAVSHLWRFGPSSGCVTIDRGIVTESFYHQAPLWEWLGWLWGRVRTDW